MTRRRTQSIISTTLLVASFSLLAAVGFLYLRDRDESNEPARPTSAPGHYQLIDIVEAIRDEGVDADFGAQGSDVRSVMLERPGQMIKLESGTAYVFIYPDKATQEVSTLDVAAEDVDLKDIAGESLSVGTAELFASSNVAVLVVDADEETIEHVQDAVTLLP